VTKKIKDNAHIPADLHSCSSFGVCRLNGADLGFLGTR